MSDESLAGLNVSRETLARLREYQQLLEKWNPAINLVARSTLAEAWSRHFLDSAQIFTLAPADARHWADLGSGGGFPGLVVAVIAREHAPAMTVTLIESDQRKATFLRTVARALDLSVRVEARRIEDVPPLRADVVSARALAPLPDLLGQAARHLAPGGIGLFLKGAGHEKELADSLANWRFDVQKIPSKTDPRAVILRIEGLARV